MDHHHHSSKKMTPPEAEESEPKLLLPTKVYERHHHQHPQATTTTDARRSSSSSVVYHHHQHHPNNNIMPGVRWTAQPVMQWLESLVAATENAEIQQQQQHYDGPITIQNVPLSQHTTRPMAAAASASVAAPPARSTDHHPVDDDGCCWADSNTVMPRQWDLTFLQQRDPFAWKYTRKMSRLACQLEESLTPAAAAAAADHLAADYQMVQTRLEFTFGRILAQFPYGTCTEFGESRLLLDTLYRETIQKLQALVDKAREPTNTTETETMTPTQNNKKQEGSPRPPVIPKKDFSKYMTLWLRDNWTNPYPDVPGMAEMAQECGVTPEVVSNWLINARTRKWRPALLKATELPHRPASLLYEDSINIFDGKPLRDLDNDNDNYESAVQQCHTSTQATAEGNGEQGKDVVDYDNNTNYYCCNHPNKRLKRTDL